nr:hydrogenase maturation protease [Candidatus Sigynarchaeota archaeon]
MAVIGVGADLREDDAIGSVIARELVDNTCNEANAHGIAIISHAESEQIQTDFALIIDASVIPEQYISTIISFQPDHIVIVDAAMMGGTACAGDIAYINPLEIDKLAFSTHTLSLGQFIELLKTMGLDATYIIIGIQPRNMDYGERISSEVSHTKVFLVSLLMKLIRRAFNNE